MSAQPAADRCTRRRLIGIGAAAVGAITSQTSGAQRQASQRTAQTGTPGVTPEPDPGPSPATSPPTTPASKRSLNVIHESELEYTGSPARGGTLRIPVHRSGLLQFAPTTQRQDPLVPWSYLDPLVRADPRTMEPRPGLAERWRWSADGRELTFALRTDVTWHDGTPFTAADARFTHLTYRDDYQSVIAGQSGLVEEIITDGDATLRVVFAEPDGAWLYNVATLPVIQRAQYFRWWEQYPPGERTLEGICFDGALPQGTGPWRVESIEPTGISFSRNERYFETPPHASGLDLIAIDGAAQRFEMWRDGKLDLVPDVTPGDVERLRDDRGQLVVVDAARSVFAAFNFDNPAKADPAMVADPVVRNAVNIAIDRERLATEAYAGFLRRNRTGIVAQPWAHDESIQNPAQQWIQVRTSMLGAGWSEVTGDGILVSPFGDRLVLTALVLDSAGPEVIRMLELVHEDLGRVGGALDIEVLSQDRFIEKWQAERTWDLIVYDLRLYPAFAEFDLFGSAWDSRTNPFGWNPGGYSNPAADAAINAWFEAVDQPDMVAALADLQQAVNDDLFGLWFGFPQDLMLVSPNVHGFRPNRMLTAGDTRLMWKSGET